MRKTLNIVASSKM